MEIMQIGLAIVAVAFEAPGRLLWKGCQFGAEFSAFALYVHGSRV